MTRLRMLFALLLLAAAPVVAQLQIVALVFVVSRVLYVYCYVTDKASLRSLVWSVGFFASVSLYALAIRSL